MVNYLYFFDIIIYTKNKTFAKKTTRVKDMIKEKRIKHIEEYIQEHSSVSMDELMSKFNVSKNTIRRDVQVLVENGSFKKVYGGVTVKHKNLESFQDRKVRNQPAKRIITKKCAAYVEDSDIIFVDSGTTTLELFDYLKEKSLTVVTNNMEFIARSFSYENLNVIVIGGILERKTNSFVNPQVTEVLNAYNINKAFMATTGISLTNGVTNASPIETDLKQTIVRRSQNVFLLADHDKFDKHGLMTYCELKDIDFLITNKEPDKKYEVYAKENQIELIVAGE